MTNPVKWMLLVTFLCNLQVEAFYMNIDEGIEVDLKYLKLKSP